MPAGSRQSHETTRPYQRTSPTPSPFHSILTDGDKRATRSTIGPAGITARKRGHAARRGEPLTCALRVRLLTISRNPPSLRSLGTHIKPRLLRWMGSRKTPDGGECAPRVPQRESGTDQRHVACEQYRGM